MTNALLMILLWPAELATIVWAVRRSGFLPFPHGTMLYLFTAQIMLTLHAYGFLYYSFVRVYTTYAYIHYYPQMFLLQATMLFALCVTVPKAKASVGDAVRELQVSDTVFWGLIGLLYSCWAIVLVSINWAVVWSNSIYLTLTEPDTALLSSDPVTRLAFSLIGPLGIVAAAATTFSLCTGRLRLGLVLLPVTTWSFLFFLSAHSRSSAAYLILAGLISAMFKRSRAAAVLLILFGFLTTLSVLWGRSSGNHGFSSLSAYFSNIAAYYELSGLDALSNIYEGVFTTAEYFSHDFRFDPVYKVMAISPLFSFMDGYDKVRDLYSIRLSYNVPNPAISEVLSFGAVYAVIYFGVQLLAGYLSARLVVRQPGLISLGLNAMVLLGSYLQFAYDTRGNFRTFFYIAVVCWFLDRRWRAEQRRLDRAAVQGEAKRPWQPRLSG